MNDLHSVGVITIAETRKVGAMIEKRYQAVAAQFRPSPKIVEGVEDFEWAADVMAGTVDNCRTDG